MIDYHSIYYNKYPNYSINGCLTNNIYNQTQSIAADFYSSHYIAVLEEEVRKLQLASMFNLPQQTCNIIQPEQEEFFDWEF